jgi:A1 cistron-splicing factor AAR2
MVPPGPHFLYYCSPNRHANEFAPTVGFFLTTHPSEVIVRKWHAQEERLIKLPEEEVTYLIDRIVFNLLYHFIFF